MRATFPTPASSETRRTDNWLVSQRVGFLEIVGSGVELSVVFAAYVGFEVNTVAFVGCSVIVGKACGCFVTEGELTQPVVTAVRSNNIVLSIIRIRISLFCNELLTLML